MMQLQTAKDLVLSYLAAMERRDLKAARACMGPNPEIMFPGGRAFSDINQIAANSGTRYRVVKKDIARVETWTDGPRVVVLVSGTLYGEWPDGTAFDGIRFVDRIEVEDGAIMRQDVWNDAGEHVLARQKDASDAL